MGHIKTTCKKTQKYSGKPSEGNRERINRGYDVREVQSGKGYDYETDYEEELNWLGLVNSIGSKNVFRIDLSINNRNLQMDLDTGASVSVINNTVWTQIGSPVLNKVSGNLRDYSHNKIPCLGYCKVNVRYGDQEHSLRLFVVKGTGSSLFGREWLSKIKLDWHELGIMKVSHDEFDLKKTVKKYETLFSNKLGLIKNIKADLSIDESNPVFRKCRPVPFAIREKLGDEIDRLESIGVIEKVKHSKWATPVVPVMKSSGDVRLCGDFKISINPRINVEQYPIPRVDELFASLRGGQKFTTLDMAEAYLQVELSDQAKSCVVINTHKGLYRYNRLCFGINSAPAIFQKTMDTILQGLDGVICYLDDILITGCNDVEHKKNLEAVFDRLQSFGVVLKLKKCAFLKDSVEYLGHVIDKNGIHTSNEKVLAVKAMPVPKNVSQLRSFLGLVNYYGKFVSELATICRPLYNLLKNDVEWSWSDKCDYAFRELKLKLASAPVLCHYDPSVPLGLACDASSVGLGIVLFHKYSDGSEKPIYYASKTLNKAEMGYSQIDKEALSIIFGIKKFHQFLYGRKFLLVTDHQPLLSIFSPVKGLPVTTSNRLLRWSIFLSGYSYDIVYKKSSLHGNADSLSRLPLACEDSSFDAEAQFINAIIKGNFSKLPVSCEDIARETMKDQDLCKILEYTQSEWPKKGDGIFYAFHNRKSEITVKDGCVLWNERVIIPGSFQQRILEQLHEAHPGIVRMKSLARQLVWWPGIDKNIEEKVRGCYECSMNKDNPRNITSPWSYPEKPWQRLHIDFAGPFRGFMWLLVADARTKWLEVFRLKTATTYTTTQCLLSIFSRFGIPEYMVSDNGSPFSSKEMSEFCRKYGVKQKFSPPFHPCSNGEAEINVKTFKRAMKCYQGADISEGLQLFLMQYRNTPHCTTGKSPSEMLLGRTSRTIASQCNPCRETRVSHTSNFVSNKLLFHPGNAVWVRGYANQPKWLQGSVLRKEGGVTYRVKLDNGKVAHRHLSQIRSRVTPSSSPAGAQSLNVPSVEDDSYLYLQNARTENTSLRLSEPSCSEDVPNTRTGNESLRLPVPSGSEEGSQLNLAPTGEARYPSRVRRPPLRYSEEFNN